VRAFFADPSVATSTPSTTSGVLKPIAEASSAPARNATNEWGTGTGSAEGLGGS